MADLESDPLFTVEGAAKDEDVRLDCTKYHAFIPKFKEREGEGAAKIDQQADPARPGRLAFFFSSPGLIVLKYIK